MKRTPYLLFLLMAAVTASIFVMKMFATETATFQVSEYGTLHWAGKENTYFIRPNGKVEMLGPVLAKVKRPERVDERTYLMNLAINVVAKEGFEVASTTGEEVLMKRSVTR